MKTQPKEKCVRESGRHSKQSSHIPSAAPAEVASMMLCRCPLYPQVATGYYFPSMLHIPLALEMILGDTWRNYFFLIYGNLCLIYSTHNCKLRKTAVFVFTTAVSSACKTIPGTG